MRKVIKMDTYLVIDGNSVYEIDQECVKQKNINYMGQSVRSNDIDQSKGFVKGRSNKRTTNKKF